MKIPPTMVPGYATDAVRRRPCVPDLQPDHVGGYVFRTVFGVNKRPIGRRTVRPCTALPGGRCFECRFCPKTFMYKHHLMDHNRTHTGERPFKCHLCTMSFARKFTLVEHTRRHTGERPHKCDFCPLRFRSRSSLTQHMKRCRNG
ncbi:putative zinc finger protein [Ixodes scapularis]